LLFASKSAIRNPIKIFCARRGERFMKPINDSQAKIQEIAKMLPPEKLREVIDFMEFLHQKEKKFVYTSVENSGEYVRSLREKESDTQKDQQKDGQEFLRELIEWQESNL
jgi:hypothetical protein